jgi:hypothetical protein
VAWLSIIFCRISTMSARSLLQVALLAQHFAADLLEGLAHGRVAGREAGAGQRLVFPDPGRFELVFAEGLHRADHQARFAVGPQPQVGLEQLAGGGLRRQPGVEPVPSRP